MEAKQVSKWQAIVISSLLILLFSSRAIYNIIIVCVRRFHNYAHNFATDLVSAYKYTFISYLSQFQQADFEPTKEGDIAYFCVLLLWEVVPICLIVLFFRIRSPYTIRVSTCTCKIMICDLIFKREHLLIKCLQSSFRHFVQVKFGI